jgi:3-dehydroquinate synthase
MKKRQKVTVDFEYPVVFTRGVFDPVNTALADMLSGAPARLLFFLDDGLVECWPELPVAIETYCNARNGHLDLLVPPERVPGGERIKNDLRILDRVGRICAEAGVDRHAYIVIVGGGAVLDAVGFAAATIHRGVRQVRLPTTTLSQGDSGVGVKNGLNRFGLKNFYGTFEPPSGVVIDFDFLDTLPRRDWLSGVAEAFKVALIRDEQLLKYLEKNAVDLLYRDRAVMEHVMSRTAELHLRHIGQSADPFERGTERPLDFGHWAAHRLEKMTSHELRHGEAVAIGIAIDLHCALKMSLISPMTLETTLNAMESCGLPLWHEVLNRRSPDGRLEVLEGLERFRQHLGGELTLAMPDGVGKMTFVHRLPETMVEEAVDFLQTRAHPCSGTTHTSPTA